MQTGATALEHREAKTAFFCSSGEPFPVGPAAKTAGRLLDAVQEEGSLEEEPVYVFIDLEQICR